MAKTRTQRTKDVLDVPHADDFGVDDDDLAYHGTADPRIWHAESWPMCERGNPQRLRHPVSYSLDDSYSRLIELHIPISDHELTCNAICVEEGDCVRVRVLVCCTSHNWDCFGAAEYGLMPVDVHPFNKLGDRRVVDYDTGSELPRRASLWPSRRDMRSLRGTPAVGQASAEDLDIPF